VVDRGRTPHVARLTRLYTAGDWSYRLEKAASSNVSIVVDGYNHCLPNDNTHISVGMARNDDPLGEILALFVIWVCIGVLLKHTGLFQPECHIFHAPCSDVRVTVPFVTVAFMFMFGHDMHLPRFVIIRKLAFVLLCIVHVGLFLSGDIYLIILSVAMFILPLALSLS